MGNDVFVMNTPILTNWGAFRFDKIEISEVKELLKNGFISAVGHSGTAELLTKLLDVEVPSNRIAIHMEIGDVAIVFRLKDRLSEGTVLTKSELEKLSFDFGLLKMIGE